MTAAMASLAARDCGSGAKATEIPDVARRDGQIVNRRRGGDQRVHDKVVRLAMLQPCPITGTRSIQGSTL